MGEIKSEPTKLETVRIIAWSCMKNKNLFFLKSIGIINKMINTMNLFTLDRFIFIMVNIN